MTRRVLLVAVLGTVVLAGCFGGPGSGPGSGPESAEPTEEPPIDGESAAAPGVSNGTLSNATALAAANQDGIRANGATVTVDWDTPSTDATFQLVSSPGFETYTLAGSPYGASPDGNVSIWTNESVRVVRTSDGGDASFRVLERGDDVPNVLEDVEDYLAAGDFTVATGTAASETDANGTGDAGRARNGTVLTADEYVGETGRRGLLENPGSFSGRLVVGESGLIHELAVDATEGDESHTYEYTLTDAEIETVSTPGWVGDVPASATLQPRLGVVAENESYLAVSSDGGDHVPSGAVITVSDNESSGEATFETELTAGDTRYAYFDNASGDLILSAERPAATDVDPLDSPVSVTIASADGATFHSGGMAWETTSASAPSDGSGASGSASGGSTSGGSASSESASGNDSSASSGESSASVS